MNEASITQDAIPQEDFLETSGPNEAGMVAQRFLAFNTAITLQAFAPEQACLAAFERVRKGARRFERLFSRTLPHSDISRLNRAEGIPIEISRDTADLLECALSYCANSDGRFDITMGAAVQLWDLRRAIIPSQNELREAVTHVDWRGVRVWEKGGRHFAQLTDPQAAVDVGGIAKGWIADRFMNALVEAGLENFLINLGGNVVAHGEKPGGAAWNIGISDPQQRGRHRGGGAASRCVRGDERHLRTLLRGGWEVLPPYSLARNGDARGNRCCRSNRYRRPISRCRGVFHHLARTWHRAGARLRARTPRHPQGDFRHAQRGRA